MGCPCQDGAKAGVPEQAYEPGSIGEYAYLQVKERLDESIRREQDLNLLVDSLYERVFHLRKALAVAAVEAAT